MAKPISHTIWISKAPFSISIRWKVAIFNSVCRYSGMPSPCSDIARFFTKSSKICKQRQRVCARAYKLRLHAARMLTSLPGDGETEYKWQVSSQLSYRSQHISSHSTYPLWSKCWSSNLTSGKEVDDMLAWLAPLVEPWSCCFSAYAHRRCNCSSKRSISDTSEFTDLGS